MVVCCEPAAGRKRGRGGRKNIALLFVSTVCRFGQTPRRMHTQRQVKTNNNNSSTQIKKKKKKKDKETKTQAASGRVCLFLFCSLVLFVSVLSSVLSLRRWLGSTSECCLVCPLLCLPCLLPPLALRPPISSLRLGLVSVGRPLRFVSLRLIFL